MAPFLRHQVQKQDFGDRWGLTLPSAQASLGALIKNLGKRQPACPVVPPQWQQWSPDSAFLCKGVWNEQSP